MRVKAKGRQKPARIYRITPAHAGKRTCRLLDVPESRDHPRTRGEKVVFYFLDVMPMGSPPHTRGKGEWSVVSLPSTGITPAHAGKSTGGWGWPGTWGDHPRTRGEKDKDFDSSTAEEGSPPHTRGKELLSRRASHRRGITPAHAGKRALAHPVQPAGRDHPRTRGEKFCSPIIPRGI